MSYEQRNAAITRARYDIMTRLNGRSFDEETATVEATEIVDGLLAGHWRPPGATEQPPPPTGPPAADRTRQRVIAQLRNEPWYRRHREDTPR